MKLIIDRFEGENAVCEDENQQTLVVLKGELPAEAKEGDFLVFENGCFSIDRESTAKRRNRIREKMNKLFN